ncbi:MAG: TolC family protein, partial [Terriglobia bacterium]
MLNCNRRGAAIVLFIILLTLRSPSRGFAEEGSVEPRTLLSLQEILRRALRDHAQVKRAEARLEKEEALLRAMKQGFFPKLASNLYMAGVTQDDRGIIFWTNEVRLPLFEGGRRIHEKRKKGIQVREEKLLLEETRQKVAYELKTLYITALKEEELARLAQGWVEESQRLYTAMKTLSEKELLTREELLRWDALVHSSQQELSKHKEALDYSQALLSELAGIPEGERIGLEPLAGVRLENQDFHALRDELRKENLLYEIARTRVEEKEEETQVLRAERWPRLGLSTRYNLARDTFVDQSRFEFGAVGTW